jgi:hypothetical protein
MNILNIPPVIGWLIVIAIFIAPSIYRITKQAYRHWRTRQLIKNTPGPLLGVIYPERFGSIKPTNEDTGR